MKKGMRSRQYSFWVVNLKTGFSEVLFMEEYIYHNCTDMDKYVHLDRAPFVLIFVTAFLTWLGVEQVECYLDS